MKSSKRQNEFSHWLDHVTDNIIEPARTQTRQELENHYLDTTEEQLARGVSVQEAHILAMAALGDAGEVALEMQSVHFSARRALWVLFACLAYPISLFVLQSMYKFLSFQMITIIATIITSIIIVFVVLSIKKLLQPFHGDLDRPIQLLFFSQVMWALCPIISYIIYGELPLMNNQGGVYLNMSTLGSAILNVAMLISELLSGTACIWLGGKLLRQQSKLIFVSGIVLTIIGLFTIILCAMIVINNQLAAAVISSLNYVLVTIVLSLLGFFFFRVFSHGYHPPMETAS
ncbi:MAG: hypothetical protein JEZ00_10845 [Anaerolineaceae bacterium]|nr:hypothetical protein [Anaerolineaceae bacterium]